MNARHTGLISTATLALALLVSCSGQKPATTAPHLDEAPPRADEGAVLLGDLTDLQIFPASDPWNLDVSKAPLDSNSQAIIDWINRRTPENPTALVKPQAYFGPPPWGIPYVVVSGTQPLLPIAFVAYPTESDNGAPGRPSGYPVPGAARYLPGYIEGNVAGGGTYGDRHMIIVDRDHGLLFETAGTRWDTTGNHWEAGCGATFDLATGAARPDGWTSADAAGLPMLPGLVRYDEAFGQREIQHAFRCNTWAGNGHVWPATHTASTTAGAPPLGLRLRLKASVDLSAYPPEIQRIFRAMKTYGLIVADNGGCDLGVTGTMDPRWDSRVLSPAFSSLSADDFEVVQLGWGQPGR